MLYAPQTMRLAPIEEHEYYAEALPQPSVMIIDDSPTVRAVIEASLRRHGFRITSFGDGLAAMGALARGEVEVPHLLLLDIGLPRMDGYEVARILRSKADFGQTTLVMLTAHDGMLDRLRGKLVGASEYITKPFNVRYVVDVVRSYLHQTPQPQ